MADFAAVRYLPGGELDETFGDGGKVVASFPEGSSTAQAVAIDEQGRIVAAGTVFTLDGTQFALVRWSPDGSLDPSLGDSGMLQTSFPEGQSSARSVAIDSTGRIIVAGHVDVDGTQRFALARYRVDGTLDTAFGGDGRVVTEFLPGMTGSATGLSIDSLGRIVAAGFTNTSAGNAFAAIRYRDDGNLDSDFEADGRVSVTFQGRDTGLAVRHDGRGRILIVGATASGGQRDAAIVRLRPDGTLDPTFGNDGRAYSDLGGSRAFARALVIDRSNRIVLAGFVQEGLKEFGVGRLLSHGDHDQTFSSDGRAQSPFFDTEGAEGVAIDSSDRVIAVGSTDTAGEGTIWALAWFRSDGSPDRSVGTDGQVFTYFAGTSANFAHAVTVDRGSRIVVVGEVGHPRTSPLGRGPFRAGFRLIPAVPIRGRNLRAVVYYPAAQEGENTPFAAAAPFPMIGYAHGNRNIGLTPCPGTPADFTIDYLQLSVILSHLARWGYVTISTDQSSDILVPGKAEMLEASVDYLRTESGRSGSPFAGKVRSTGTVLMGHSTGGGAAIQLARSTSLDVAAVATLSPGGVAGDAAALAVPLLVEHGSEEGTAEGGNSRELYDAAHAPKHYALVHGANHFGYTDELCIVEAPPATIARSDQQRIAYAYLVAFLQRYVRGETFYTPILNGLQKIEGLEAFDITVESSA